MLHLKSLIDWLVEVLCTLLFFVYLFSFSHLSFSFQQFSLKTWDRAALVDVGVVWWAGGLGWGYLYDKISS